jgi:hypothetical protein
VERRPCRSLVRRDAREAPRSRKDAGCAPLRGGSTGIAPPVPEDRSRLAALHGQPGSWGLPGGRHGPRQDHPDPGPAALAQARCHGACPVAAGRPGFAARQLEGRGAALRAVAASADRASLGRRAGEGAALRRRSGRRAGRDRPGGDHLRHGGARRVARGRGLADGDPRRGPGDQEFRHAPGTRRQAAPGDGQAGADRHAGREPPRRPLVALRLHQPRTARKREGLRAVCPRTPGPARCLRPRASAGAALHPAPAQDRPPRDLPIFRTRP